jgi:hypothetical protein
MVTNNYHDNQDIPNLNDAGTALDLFQQQANALASVDQEAQAILGEIEQSLGKTLNFARDKGLTKLEERVQKQWELAQRQHRHVTHLKAALGGAGTAIQALAQQRDAITSEHARLVEAIDSSDESHPQLASFADSIRENEQESIYFSGVYENDMEIDFEFVYERNCEQIAETWSDQVEPSMVSRVLDAVLGDLTMTDEQRAAFIAFLGTLNVGRAAS